MLNWEITVVCSELLVRKKRMNAHCGQNVTILCTKPDGAKLFQLSQFGYTVLHRIFVTNKLEESRTKHL
jgi:hypothetical protein